MPFSTPNLRGVNSLRMLGRLCLRAYLYAENLNFKPELNGENSLLTRLNASGFRPKTVFDVGANKGNWTDVALGLWPEAHYHLVDPIPSLVENLRRKYQERQNVQVHQYGMSGKSGELCFEENTEISSHSRSVTTQSAGANAHIVRVVTLPELCKEAGVNRIEFLKLDAEGHDIGICFGMKQMLEHRAIEVFQFEHCAIAVHYERPIKELFEMLMSVGYRVGKLFPQGVEFYDKPKQFISELVGPNFVAVSPDREDLLQTIAR